MKVLKLFYPWIIVALFLLAVFYYIFVWQRKDSDKLSVRGEVENIEKQRGSVHNVEIREGTNIRHLSYSFRENESDLHIGDSVFKEKDSKILYIKSAKDGITREAKDQDYLLGR